MKHDGYFTRALNASDPRYARVFGKLGYSRSDMAAADGQPADTAVPPFEIGSSDDLQALRETYQRAVGKRPFHGWDAGELRQRIADAGQAGS